MSDFDDLLERLRAAGVDRVVFLCDLTMGVDHSERWLVTASTNGEPLRKPIRHARGITGQGALQTLVDKVAPHA